MHFPVAVAVAIASALPAVLAQSPDQIEAQANAELGKEVDKAIAQNLKSEDTAPVYYNPATRLKLFGTDNTYQPYTVACPANVTWVRPATDVSRVVDISTTMMKLD